MEGYSDLSKSETIPLGIAVKMICGQDGSIKNAATRKRVRDNIRDDARAGKIRLDESQTPHHLYVKEIFDWALKKYTGRKNFLDRQKHILKLYADHKIPSVIRVKNSFAGAFCTEMHTFTYPRDYKGLLTLCREEHNKRLNTENENSRLRKKISALEHELDPVRRKRKGNVQGGRNSKGKPKSY